MSKIPKIEIDELFCKYSLHPELVDIFVEGDFDRAFINLFLHELMDDSCTTILPISQIEVSDDILHSLNLNLRSNKSRVIALATLLDVKFGRRATNISCIVDSDLDRILDKIISLHHLKYTDYTCMEMYLLNNPTLKKFLVFCCDLNENSVDEFLAIAKNILPSQFALRSVNDDLNLNTTIPKFSCGLNKKKEIASFDRLKYLLTYIQDGQLTSRKHEIQTSFEKYINKLTNEDMRNKTYGHDFVDLLYQYSWDKGGVRFQNKGEDILKFGGRILTTALDTKTLLNETLFNRISSAIKGNGFICAL